MPRIGYKIPGVDKVVEVGSTNEVHISEDLTDVAVDELLAEAYPKSLLVKDGGANVAHFAALYGCPECLDIIARVDKRLLIARNDNGYTPKEWAEEKQNNEFIHALKSAYNKY